ncbi:unnamed protein product [Acanthoscelides obtectus]|uniref:Uncharacterized protein n=1 Tax=Acanthoscelides obtectus TaxID=200917 RepID=A0A9P0PTA4_ACAOB|nr:unnamed protein product [Acanthoscelides obtectus]CAK1627130.1 hypothetical protein AOBTE_LOCUS4327 [Acanthoscelides obtectus]
MTEVHAVATRAALRPSSSVLHTCCSELPASEPKSPLAQDIITKWHQGRKHRPRRKFYKRKRMLNGKRTSASRTTRREGKR